jgi:hypothetical protein
LEQQLNHRAWFESPKTRLKMWRGFRQSLDIENTLEVCQTVVDWWKTSPIVSISIDPVDCSEWPTPWEMLHQGDFCENSLALGMAYTIYYANNRIPNRLVFVQNKKDSIQKLCALIDEKYLLNYRHGVISTTPDDETIIYSVDIDTVVKSRY